MQACRKTPIRGIAQFAAWSGVNWKSEERASWRAIDRFRESVRIARLQWEGRGMADKRAGMGEGSGQLLATLQTMAASLARIEAAMDRAEAGRSGPDLAPVHIGHAIARETLDPPTKTRVRCAQGLASGGIDHDDAKALRRMAAGGGEYADGEARAWREVTGITREEAAARKADGPHTDQAPTVDRAGESEGERPPWWLRPW